MSDRAYQAPVSIRILRNVRTGSHREPGDIDLLASPAYQRESGDERVGRIYFLRKMATANRSSNPFLHGLAFGAHLAPEELELDLRDSRLDWFHTICNLLLAMSNL